MTKATLRTKESKITKVVHCKKESFDVYIGRKNTRNHYGNPFVVGVNGTQEEVVEKCNIWLSGHGYRNVEPERRQWILDNVHALKGKIIGCWCDEPKPCHGHILVRLAEGS